MHKGEIGTHLYKHTYVHLHAHAIADADAEAEADADRRRRCTRTHTHTNATFCMVVCWNKLLLEIILWVPINVFFFLFLKFNLYRRTVRNVHYYVWKCTYFLLQCLPDEPHSGAEIDPWWKLRIENHPCSFALTLPKRKKNWNIYRRMDCLSFLELLRNRTTMVPLPG